MKDLKIDKETAQRFIAGDKETLAMIYKMTSEMIYNVVYRIVLNDADAKDITQDVYVKAYEKRTSFRGDAGVSTWLYKIAVNTAVNFSKRRSFIAGLQEKAGLFRYDPPAPDDRLEDDREDIKLVKQLLKRVRPDHRTCLVLREIEGLSYQEISELLGLNIGTVRSRINRGRNELKILYEKAVK